MRSTRRIKMAFALATGLLLALVSAAPAAAAGGAPSPPTAPKWTLLGAEQRICIPANTNWWTYFGIFISGSRPAIVVGARNLPTGTTTSLPHAPIPPGTNDGSMALNLIAMTLPPLAPGDYHPELIASDGVRTQSVAITIRAHDHFGC